MTKSGLYTQTISDHASTLHIDVDGNYPQMKASLNLVGSIIDGHWIADLSPDGTDTWTGDIWYRKGDATTAKVSSDVRLGGASGSIPDRMKIEYKGYYSAGGFYWAQMTLLKSGTDEHWYYWHQKQSDHFRTVNVEFDYEAGVNQIFSLNPHDVDNHRPASVPNEAITVQSTFLKAGVKIESPVTGGSVATSGAGSNSKWSNAELHDAMQTAWSQNESSAWSMWVIQANKHEDDHTGIMFDTIGNFERSGTALFHGQSSYSGAPAGVVNRHKFHTLVHEMGHTFNMYHSWIKTSGTSNWHSSVINEAEARSYMNYPDRVNAGYHGFFDTFEYRFSDQELVFLRHAPPELVRMGGSAWGDDHAGSTMGNDPQMPAGRDPDAPRNFALTVRSNKDKPVFDYLELVQLELKLENTSGAAQELPEGMLNDVAHMHVSVSRNGQKPRSYRPYTTPCTKVEPMTTLQPGRSVYGSFMLSAGKFGWVVSEPGAYRVTVSVPIPGTENETAGGTFDFIVREPGLLDRQTRREQENLAQDYFRDDVGRALAMGGTKVLRAANDTMQELTERFPDANAARHAGLALAMPNMREFKVINFADDGTKSLTSDSADQAAAEAAKAVLVDHADETIETLGHIQFNRLSEKVANSISELGDNQAAAATMQNVADTLQRRGVTLPDEVSQAITDKVTALQSGS